VLHGSPSVGVRMHRDIAPMVTHVSPMVAHDSLRVESQACPDAAFVAQTLLEVQ
jgi:hypothetical protein